MAIRTYKVTLDSKNVIAPEPVYLRQGDKTGAVVIDATLMDNGAPVSLNGLTPMFKANTADGQAVIADNNGFSITNPSGGELTYQVPNALAAVAGKITTAYFSFSDASGAESTFDVAFIVKKAVDITQEQASDYVAIIDGTMRTLQQKVDAMNNSIQTVVNAYNQGAFYNREQTDSKDAVTFQAPMYILTVHSKVYRLFRKPSPIWPRFKLNIRMEQMVSWWPLTTGTSIFGQITYGLMQAYIRVLALQTTALG